MTKKILVIDDSPTIVEMTKAMLEEADYSVITATDGMEGLDKAREEKPDLILLDVMMPKMDGYEVCRLLKYDEEFETTPIIMLTARTQAKDKSIGKDVGADDYITKPFDGTDLLEKIKKLL